MTNKYIESIARNAIIAALYVVITVLCMPISYNALQFRISEILILLVFFRKDYSIGIILGTALSNLFSSLGFFDVLFGTIATALACVCIMFMKQLAIASLFPIIFNAFIVGFELWWLMEESFWISVGWVALGEVVVIVAGYILFMIFGKRKNFQKTIRATQNLQFKW